MSGWGGGQRAGGKTLGEGIDPLQRGFLQQNHSHPCLGNFPGQNLTDFAHVWPTTLFRRSFDSLWYGGADQYMWQEGRGAIACLLS